MSAYLDTNILIHHLTGDPPGQAARATAYLASGSELYLADVIVAEMVYVLESFYEVPRKRVAELARSAVVMDGVVAETDVLLRAIEIYEVNRLDFAEAYLVACAESSGVDAVATFDRSVDRVGTVCRVEP